MIPFKDANSFDTHIPDRGEDMPDFDPSHGLNSFCDSDAPGTARADNFAPAVAEMPIVKIHVLNPRP